MRPNWPARAAFAPRGYMRCRAVGVLDYNYSNFIFCHHRLLTGGQLDLNADNYSFTS
jgi:hypothetical protein